MKTTNNTAVALGTYAPPKCSIITVTTEGVLCSSFDKLGNEFDYVWGTEE